MKSKGMKKDKRKRERPPLNLRLIGGIALLITGIFLKLYPTGFNSLMGVVFKADCDYHAMVSDIGGVIRVHTMGSRILSLPLSGEITSPFGLRQRPDGDGEEEHTGVDINAAENTPVNSAYRGKVIRVEENEFYGKFIMIEHLPSLVTLYGHLNSQSVSVGDFVEADTEIGLSGSTGRSTGPHLHFEVRKDGKCVNPMDYIF